MVASWQFTEFVAAPMEVNDSRKEECAAFISLPLKRWDHPSAVDELDSIETIGESMNEGTSQPTNKENGEEGDGGSRKRKREKNEKKESEKGKKNKKETKRRGRRKRGEEEEVVAPAPVIEIPWNSGIVSPFSTDAMALFGTSAEPAKKVEVVESVQIRLHWYWSGEKDGTRDYAFLHSHIWKKMKATTAMGDPITKKKKDVILLVAGEEISAWDKSLVDRPEWLFMKLGFGHVTRSQLIFALLCGLADPCHYWSACEADETLEAGIERCFEPEPPPRNPARVDKQLRTGGKMDAIVIT